MPIAEAGVETSEAGAASSGTAAPIDLGPRRVFYSIKDASGNESGRIVLGDLAYAAAEEIAAEVGGTKVPSPPHPVYDEKDLVVQGRDETPATTTVEAEALATEVDSEAASSKNPMTSEQAV